jgi:predicted SnoaL-like aldol condensation-catalyzing enzyme
MSHKDDALSFLRLAAAGRAREALDKHAAPGFRHHNPYFADAAALVAGMDDNAQQYPRKVLEVQRAIEEADLVAVHSRVRMQPGEPGIAVVHIFRFEDCRIAEFWDIAQPVPAQSPNAGGMF